MSEPIAIVGVACRYPDAHGPGQLWHSVLHQRVAFRRMPGERLPDDYRSLDGGDPDRTYVTHAAVLEGWEFDRERFRVPANLHRAADHTHWLALETASEVLDDAGFPMARGLDTARAGVVIGNSLTGEFARSQLLRLRWPFVRRLVAAALDEHLAGGAPDHLLADLEQRLKSHFPAPGDETLAGGLSNTIAGRICNHFDLRGAGYAVDGACASSLLAVNTACRLLRDGELDFAVAGGVDLSLDPFELVGFARLGALSRGPMRVYDQEPTGFLPGEGCGMVALMRAGDAERAGKRMYALVAGTGMSSDGAGGLTRPHASGQARACRRAYEDAGLDPHDVALFEGHGTGTEVGDRVELETLTGLREGSKGAAALGSVKANVGHTKAAAGAAGLLKAALALHHEVLPPTTGCRTPHDLLVDSGTLRVLGAPEAWGERPRLAGVSASGFGGMNTHVVVRGADRRPRRPRTPATPRQPVAQGRPDVLLVTAHAPAAAGRTLERLRDVGGDLSQAELHDCAATLATTSDLTHPFRVALCVDRPEQLPALAGHACRALGEAAANGTAGGVLVPEPGVYVGSGPRADVGLLFPGQGAPLPQGLGIIERLLPDGPASPAAALVAGGSPSGADDRVVDTRDAQPLIVAASLLGLRWLDALGVTATAAAGHSLGEIVALCWAGALGEEDALRLAAVRGQAMSTDGLPGTGMTSLGVDERTAVGLIDGTGAVVAGVNSARQTVVAGPSAALAEVEQRAGRCAVAATRLPVSHAFHSPAMAPVQPALLAALRQVEFAPLAGEVVSTVTGKVLGGTDDPITLLVAQLTEPVRFSEAAERLGARCDLLVEVGTGQVLSGLVAEAHGIPAVSTALEDAGLGLARTTAALAAAGAADTVQPWFADRGDRPFDLSRPLRFLPNPCEAGVPTQRGDIPAAAPSPEVARQPAAVPAFAPADTVAGLAPLTLLRQCLAESLELDESLITPDQGLLRDLHLNSLQVVQLIGRAADALGRARPARPLTLADATVADAAEVLSGLPARSDEPEPHAPGVGAWVRAFADRWEAVAWEPGGGTSADHAWDVLAPPTHTPAVDLPGRDTGDTRSPALLVLVTGSREERVATLHDACQRAVGGGYRRIAVAHDDGAGASLARSIAQERPGTVVASIMCDLGGTALERGLAVACSRPEPFIDIRLDRGGAAQRRVVQAYHLADGPPDFPLAEGDVCLVTGGVRGITTECALALAQATGCRLVTLGRTPADDPAVREALARLRENVACDYVEADLADPRAVAGAVSAARAYGPVRGLLHGAGVNVPAGLDEVGPSSLAHALVPKVDGLRHLLAELGRDELLLVAGFGSIIGRMGLPGQTDYCVANDWLRLELEDVARQRPACRVRALEWSVWSGVGMGVRMGVLDDLARRGVAAIGPRDGVELFLGVVGRADVPVTSLLTGRLPATPTLELASPPVPLLRFVEDVRVRVPGVEVVADARLSLPSDLFLDGHRIDGTLVLPGVASLEAAAQVADATDPSRSWRRFLDVELPGPVIIDEDRERAVRVATLAASPDRLRVTVRSDEDRFASDRVRLTLAPAADPPQRDRPADDPPPPPAGGHPYYGTLFFHGGRYRRLRAYRHVSALRCHAWIDTGSDPHFSSFHPPALLLGDLTTHDACIHVLQACLPHRRVVPVRIRELSAWRQPSGVLEVRAHQREQRGMEYCFDVDVVDAEGTPVARWDELWLRAVGDAGGGCLTAVELLGSYLARTAHEFGLTRTLDLLVAPAGTEPDEVMPWLAGSPVRVSHTPDGRLVCDRGHASVSHASGGLLVAYADQPVGVDWTESSGDGLPDALDPSHRDLALAVAQKTGEPLEVAGLRVWTAIEALVKAGRTADAPLVLTEVQVGGVVLAAGATTVATVAVKPGDLPRGIVAAVAVAEDGD